MFYGGIAPSLKVKTPKALKTSKGGRGEGADEGYKSQLRSITLCAPYLRHCGLILPVPEKITFPFRLCSTICVLLKEGKSYGTLAAVCEGRRGGEEGVLRLLIVEDEAPIVEVVAAYAGREGYETLWTADGEAAMSLL